MIPKVTPSAYAQRIPVPFLLAVRDCYLKFDQEDFCEEGIKRCGKCGGCAMYRNLANAFRIVKKNYPGSVND